MAQQERVNGALSQLVDRTLPSDPDEDETAADERFAEALELAQSIVNSSSESPVAPDVNHVTELIRAKLSSSASAESLQRFNNLSSRLLSQPVLTRRWAILYLLHLLSDKAEPQARTSSYELGAQIPSRPNPSQIISPMHSPHDNRAFDEAFSRGGLANLPSPSERKDGSITYQQSGTQRKEKFLTNGDGRIGRDIDGAKGHRTQAQNSSESALLRDLPFILQGVSSTSMAFTTPTTLKLPPNLPGPIISLLHALAEPSLLYKGLSSFVESSDGGLVRQSLRAAIAIEIRSYLGLVATLEGQIRRALVVLEENNSKQGLGKAGVTLRRCVIWTREATMGLRLMSLIVEESKTRKGGQLISLIHSFASSHGDPFVGAFAERLLAHVTRPFYDLLRLWIYDGELQDPYLEFFVSEQHDTGDDDTAKGGATSVWEDKYKLDEQMIPTIITSEFAQKVFLIGKSLNFIRYGCGDSAWVESYSKEASRELRYGDTATLESSIDEAYKTTMARLIHLMTDKFKLVEHLTALKKYLLLGQGDFIALLMESLSSNLDRPANSQYRHTLTAQLEHAIRNSNAQYDSPDVLRRLDARMLELSHGEIGWDVFTLEYKIDAPVDVVVTPYGSKQYLKVFNFLWRVKRVEYALGSTWRRCMTGARGVLGSVADKVGADWKTARCAIAEMIHFVCQLQYYILFEVIEASWEQLQKAINTPGATLDDLIQAHARYLKAITRKGLLGSSNMDFTAQLHQLLKTMLAYKDAVDGLYSFSVAESSRRAEKSARIETRTRQGKWGITERDETDYFDDSVRSNKNLPRASDVESPMPPPLLAIGGAAGASGAGVASTSSTDASVLPALRQRLAELSTDFRARVCGLLGDLAYQPDPDMRFLGVVMNFNDTYKIVRRSRRKQGGTSGEKEKEKARAEKVRDMERDSGAASATGGAVRKADANSRDES